MRKAVVRLLLAGTLLCVKPGLAQNHYRDDRHHDSRYYDREHRDYHEWNEREARAWRRYWRERRRQELAWERANDRQRREYWRWRHSHPD